MPSLPSLVYHPPYPPPFALIIVNAPHSVFVLVRHMGEIILTPVIIAPLPRAASFTFHDHLTSLVTTSLANHDTFVPGTDVKDPITEGQYRWNCACCLVNAIISPSTAARLNCS